LTAKRKRSPSPPRSYDPSKRQKSGWDQTPSFEKPPIDPATGAPVANFAFPGMPLVNADGTPAAMPFGVRIIIELRRVLIHSNLFSSVNVPIHAKPINKTI